MPAFIPSPAFFVSSCCFLLWCAFFTVLGNKQNISRFTNDFIFFKAKHCLCPCIPAIYTPVKVKGINGVVFSAFYYQAHPLIQSTRRFFCLLALGNIHKNHHHASYTVFRCAVWLYLH